MSDGKPLAPAPPQLSGESLPDAYSMRTGDGNSIRPGYAIFSIVRHGAGDKMHLLGMARCLKHYPMANPLCRKQEKRTMHEIEG
jgi:hypothetical protein